MKRAGQEYTPPASRESGPDDLSAFRDVLTALEVVRDVPPAGAGAMAAGRRRFLSAAAGLRDERARRPLRWTALLRPALLPLALLVLVVGATTGVIAAAQSAWPATPLYPVKLAWEDLRLALASGPQARAELALEYCGERIAEIEQLNAAGRLIPDTVLQRLDLEMRQALQNAAQLADPQIVGLLQQLQEAAALRSQALEQALQSAPPQNQAAIAQGIAIMTGAQSWITLGLEDPAAFRTLGGSTTGFPALLSPPPTTAVPPGPTGTPGPPSPVPSLPPTPTPPATATARPSHTPTPPEQTAPGQTVPPTPTVGQPPTPGPNRTPATTRTSGAGHSPTAPTPEPTQTQGPPEHTQGPPAQPTHRPP